MNSTKILSVIGLGYVGLPLAVAFADAGFEVIGFDLNSNKIELYKNGIDPTNEVGNDTMKNTTILFTDDPSQLRRADFHIIAVPTPVSPDHTPELTPVTKASETLGKNMKKGSIAVYESTVYPGVTEDVCIPILEETSGLKCGPDFKVGYSPERINPGDKVHRLENIKKIVSGCDDEALEIIKNVYDKIIKVGTCAVSSIKTAEAIKVVENSQRDINIAFMNELSMVFDRMGIDTNEVVDGMNTKWNALGFRPGLVGGHCIAVDPYYFTYEAEKLGYHSRIVLNGRMVNDSMASYVAEASIKKMVQAGMAPANAKVAVMGITFKENCPDTRNSKVVEIVDCLKEYGINAIVTDPCANPEDVKREYDIELVGMDELKELDCIILAVAHDEFRKIGLDEYAELFKKIPDDKKVLIDVKGIFKLSELKEKGFSYWRL